MKKNLVKNRLRLLKEEFDNNNQMNTSIIAPTEDWMSSTYDKFNKMYWGGKLPSNLSFKRNGRLKRAFAIARYSTTDWKDNGDGSYSCELDKITGIEFSTYYKGEAWVFEASMLHEMIHIADYFFHPEHFGLIWKNGRTFSSFKKGGYDAHGPIFFMKEVQRLSQYGWKIEICLTNEEASKLTVSDEEFEKTSKKRNAAVRKREKAFARWKQLYYTINMVEQKSKILNTLITKYTNNFTQPLGYREVNIGELKVILTTKGNFSIRGYVLDLDEKDSNQVKYKAELCLPETINEPPFEGHVDWCSVFENDCMERYDLEDDYGF